MGFCWPSRGGLWGGAGGRDGDRATSSAWSAPHNEAAALPSIVQKIRDQATEAARLVHTDIGACFPPVPLLVAFQLVYPKFWLEDVVIIGHLRVITSFFGSPRQVKKADTIIMVPPPLDCMALQSELLAFVDKMRTWVAENRVMEEGPRSGRGQQEAEAASNSSDDDDEKENHTTLCQLFWAHVASRHRGNSQ